MALVILPHSKANLNLVCSLDGYVCQMLMVWLDRPLFIELYSEDRHLFIRVGWLALKRFG